MDNKTPEQHNLTNKPTSTFNGDHLRQELGKPPSNVPGQELGEGFSKALKSDQPTIQETTHSTQNPNPKTPSSETSLLAKIRQKLGI